VTSIGFIGLGIMGSPMAANLIKAGHDVIGYDHSTKAVDQLKADGGQAAESLADAVREVDIVITMVPDSPEVKAAALGEQGIYANGRSGSLHIDCSSISPDAAREVAAAGAERGFRVVDAPVSGGQSGAVEASLSIMVGGSEADVAQALPVLEAVGKTVVHVGPSGSGQTVKAWTLRQQSRCWPAAWRAMRSCSARPQACSLATSRRVSGLTCITRTWAS